MGSSQPFFDWAGFPAGVRFEPTDVQLLDHLLAKLDEEHASIDDDEQTLKPGVKRQASRGKENIAGGVGSKPRVQKPRRQQHPRMGEFIPTLGFEDGICSVYPEDLPGIVTDGATRDYFQELLFSRPNINHDAFPCPPSLLFSPCAHLVRDGTKRHCFHRVSHALAVQARQTAHIPFPSLLLQALDRDRWHHSALLPPPNAHLGHRAAQEGQTALRVDSNHQSFRSVLSPPAGIVTDGTTRHYFHRPSRAYAMGLRKRRKIFSDRPSAATLPPGTVGGADAGGGREECGYRWHKTGKTRPVFARNRKQIGWKKILVLYETRAQRGKKRGADERSSPAGGSGKDRKTNWIMHQYHVGEQGEEKEGEWVVSKVFYQIQQRQSSGTRAGSREGSLPPLGQGADEEECGAEGREDIEAVGKGEGGGAEEEEGEEEEVVDDIEDVNDEDGDGDGSMAGTPRAAVAGRGGGLVSGAGGASVAAGGSVVTAGGSAGAAGGSTVTAGRRGRGGRGGRGVSQGGRGGSRGGRPTKGGVLATRGTFQASQPSPTSAAAASFGAAFLPPGHHPPPLLPAASPVSTAAGAASGAISGAFSGADLITAAEAAAAGAAGALAGPARLLSFHNQAPPCGVQEGASLGTAGPPNTGVHGIGFTPFSRKGGVPAGLAGAGAAAAAAAAAAGSVRASTGGVTAGEITSITSNSSGSGHGSGSAGGMFLSPPPNAQRRVGLGGLKPLDTGAAGAGASAAAGGGSAAEPVTPSSTAMPVPITPPSAHSASGLVVLKPPGWGGEAGRLVPCQLQQQQQQGNHAATTAPGTEAATDAGGVGGGAAGVSDLRAYEQSLGDSASDIGSYPHSQEAPVQATPPMQCAATTSLPVTAVPGMGPGQVHGMGSQEENGAAGKWETGSEAMTLEEATQRHRGTPDDYPFRFLSTPTDEHTDGSPKKAEWNMEGGCAEGGTPGVGCTGVGGGNATHINAVRSDGSRRGGEAEITGAEGKSLWKPAPRRFSPPAAARGDARGGGSINGPAPVAADAAITVAAVSDALKDALQEPLRDSLKEQWSIPASQELPLPSTPIFLSQELPPIEHLPSSLPSLPPSQEHVVCFEATQPVDLGEGEGGVGGMGREGEEGGMGREGGMGLAEGERGGAGGMGERGAGQMDVEGDGGIGGMGAMREMGEKGEEQSEGESEEAIQETQLQAEEVGDREVHVGQEEQQGQLKQRLQKEQHQESTGGNDSGNGSGSEAKDSSPLDLLMLALSGEQGGDGEKECVEQQGPNSTPPLALSNGAVSAEGGGRSRVGPGTVLGSEAGMGSTREGVCRAYEGEVTGAGEGAAVGSCGVATGAVGGCGAMPGAVGSGVLGAAFWIGSSGPGMSNGTWGEWMGPARSGETEIVGGLGSEGHAGAGSECQGREQGRLNGEGNGAVEEGTIGMGGLMSLREKKDKEEQGDERGGRGADTSDKGEGGSGVREETGGRGKEGSVEGSSLGSEKTAMTIPRMFLRSSNHEQSEGGSQQSGSASGLSKGAVVGATGGRKGKRGGTSGGRGRRKGVGGGEGGVGKRQYCLPYETVLVMKEKMFSLSEAKKVKDTNGNLHFKVANRLLSIHNKTEIQDARGAPVCMLVGKVLTLHNTTYLCPGSSTETDGHLLRARRPYITFQPVIEIVTCNNMLLAEVNRDMCTARDLVFGAQTYFVRILPNVDMALVLALVTLADTMYVNNQGLA
ncbi:unnamed protein product [Closterium sp. NIES-64]|nr:unnamed protein product [Closterium sp. NIES-64]